MAVKKSGKATAPAVASKMDASGAIIEEKAVKDALQDHPAVDLNPREGTSAEQNRIDFNDPTKTPAEAVADALKA